MLTSVIVVKPVVCARKVVSIAAFDVLIDWISDVFLLDINMELAKGEDLDIIQVVPAIEFDKEIQGTDDIIEMEVLSLSSLLLVKVESLV